MSDLSDYNILGPTNHRKKFVVLNVELLIGNYQLLKRRLIIAFVFANVLHKCNLFK